MAGTTVITAARLIDGTGSGPVGDAAVVVEGDRITAVGARGAVAVPDGATTIDMGDRTLLPGFVDAHTHITINPGLAGIIGQLEGINEVDTRQVLRGSRNLRLDLEFLVPERLHHEGIPFLELIAVQSRDDRDQDVLMGDQDQVAGVGLRAEHGDARGTALSSALEEIRRGLVTPERELGRVAAPPHRTRLHGSDRNLERGEILSDL